MKAIVRKVDEKEALDSLHAHCKCGGSMLHIWTECMQCIIKDRRKRIIDLTGPYMYCETCDDIQYHGVEEAGGYKELIQCLGCWNKEQNVKGRESHS